MNLTQTCPTRSRSTSSSLLTPVVYVVDGTDSVRHEVASLIVSAGWEARTAASAEEFLTQPRALVPSCLLVEQRLPGLSAFDLQRRLVDRPEMPIIFMSGHPDVQATVQAMKAGAFEFLVKPLAQGVVLNAIASAIEHSRTTIRHVARALALQQRYQTLSQREREVMNLVVVGRLNKEVGGELGISEITVKAHRGKVMRKMQAASIAELVTMAARLPAGMPHHDVSFTRYAP